MRGLVSDWPVLNLASASLQNPNFRIELRSVPCAS
jgi:hypothetical protein